MNVIEIMKWFNLFEGFFQTPASSVFMHPDLFKIFNYFINITFSNINHLNTGIILFIARDALLSKNFLVRFLPNCTFFPDFAELKPKRTIS